MASPAKSPSKCLTRSSGSLEKQVEGPKKKRAKSNPDKVAVEEAENEAEILDKDATLRQGLVEKGRQQREKYSWERSEKRLYDLIQKVASA